jgi:hypothetical protein
VSHDVTAGEEYSYAEYSATSGPETPGVSNPSSPVTSPTAGEKVSNWGVACCGLWQFCMKGTASETHQVHLLLQGVYW